MFIKMKGVEPIACNRGLSALEAQRGKTDE